MKEFNPIDDIPGSKISLLSCSVNEFNIGFLINAMMVADAALIPGVLVNVSIIRPIKKAHSIKVFLLALELYINKKNIYRKGVPYP